MRQKNITKYTDNKLQINHTLTQIHKALRYDKKKTEKIMMNKKNKRLCFLIQGKTFATNNQQILWLIYILLIEKLTEKKPVKNLFCFYLSDLM